MWVSYCTFKFPPDEEHVRWRRYVKKRRSGARNMCGRTACSLNPDAISCACSYKDAAGKQRTTSWTKSDVEYVPSYNIGPKGVLPCVVAGPHFGQEDERILCSMMWSMIPPWHQGDYRKHNLSTHNARLENLKTSKLYNPPLRKGQRCIVMCEGYYEWKAGKSKQEPKQPYYIYAAQEKGVGADDPSTWKDEWSEETGWKGFKMLKMAGIYNTFKTEDGKTIYSCSVFTKDSNKVLSWLHNRVPVFLLTEEDAEIWLNDEISVGEAVDMLNKITLSDGDLSWHPVSTLVNNVSHKSEECRKEIKLVEEKKSNPPSLMASWLKKGTAESAKRKSTSHDDDHNIEKEKSNKRSSKIAKKK